MICLNKNRSTHYFVPYSLRKVRFEPRIKLKFRDNATKREKKWLLNFILTFKASSSKKMSECAVKGNAYERYTCLGVGICERLIERREFGPRGHARITPNRLCVFHIL